MSLCLFEPAKPGGLNLSRSCLDLESWSRRCHRVPLDSRENLDSVKKCISTVKKSWSRSRLLDFVLTSMSTPKTFNRDQEICRDLKILAFLESLSRSQSRSVLIFAFSRRDFSWFSDSKVIANVKISWQISTASRQSRQKSRRVKVSTEKSWF